jgi:pimeloyl-ACP methyl ester carboxylesterase
MKEGTVHANGIEFATIEEGDGPLVLLLHGYPDIAQTWTAQIHALAAAGYRAVAPNLRGYPPTDVPPNGYYDPATLANDVIGLIDQLAGEPSFYVGHDWGAAIGYRTVAGYPDRFKRVAQLAIPHPLSMFVNLLASPAHIQGVFHFWFFQMQGFAEEALKANDLAMIDYLWKLWSPKLDEPEHRAAVKEALRQPGALEASIAYYRAAMGTLAGDPALEEQQGPLNGPTAVPTMTILGSEDPNGRNAEVQAPFFTGPLEIAYVDGTGHFLHREKPDEVSKLLVDWFAQA